MTTQTAPHPGLPAPTHPGYDSLGQALPEWVTVVPIDPEPDHLAIYDPVTGTETRYMTVHPYTARRWLDNYNHGNRPKKVRTIASYKDDNVNDRWPFVADTISFGRDQAILYDGQHRLETIAQTGIGRRYLVVRGLTADARPVIDGGHARNLMDAITVAGISAGDSAAINNIFRSVARRAAYWHAGERLPTRAGGRGRVLTKLEIVGFVSERAAELAHAARRGRHLYRATHIPASIAGFGFWLMEGVDPDQASTFYEQIESVAGLYADVPDNSPVRVLLRRIAAAGRPGAPATSKLGDADHLYLLLRTWILWRHDRTVTSIPLPWGRGKPQGEHIPDPDTALRPLAGAAATSNTDGIFGGTLGGGPDDDDEPDGGEPDGQN